MDGLRAFEGLVTLLDYILSNKSRRHIVGGGLLSVSALFAGFAITAMTLKTEEDEDHD